MLNELSCGRAWRAEKMKTIPRIPQQSSVLWPISIKYLIAKVMKFIAAAEAYRVYICEKAQHWKEESI